VRAFSSWEVGVLGGGIEVVGVGEVWSLLAIVVVLWSPPGIWTLSLRMYSFSFSLDEQFGDDACSDEATRRQRNRIRRSGGVTPWHCRKSVMGSRRWYEVPSGKVRVLSRKGRGSICFLFCEVDIRIESGLVVGLIVKEL
jgi:hypothetical protein